MNKDAEKLKAFLFKIIDEHKFACRKHPKFCDKMTNCVSADFMKKSELLYKRFNSKPPYSAESILEEEIREALSAYLEGDKVHAIEELAQCGAVILRMMEFVSKEIEVKNPWNERRMNNDEHPHYRTKRAHRRHRLASFQRRQQGFI